MTIQNMTAFVNSIGKKFGGPDSGNFGHEGRPGKVGGSADDPKAKEKLEKEIDSYLKAARAKRGYGVRAQTREKFWKERKKQK